MAYRLVNMTGGIYENVLTANATSTLDASYQQVFNLAPLVLGKFYRFQLLMVFSGNTAADMKFRVSRVGLSDAVLRFATDLDNTGAATVTWNGVVNCAAAGGTVVNMARADGFVQTVSDPGNLVIEWGQQTANAEATILRAGSNLLLTQLN